MIMDGTKTIEYRAATPFWTKRLIPPPDVAVFVCGKIVHRRRIKNVVLIDSPDFSPQGQKDVPTEKCYGILLGDVYNA
jgi:hypothetical protein